MPGRGVHMSRSVITASIAVLLLSCSAAGPKPVPETAVPPVYTKAEEPTAPAIDLTPLSPESVLLAEADHYYALAVASAARKDFDQAEYQFEKSLEVLAQLDPETDFTQHEASHIDHLLEHIGADYRSTIRARGDKLTSPEMSAFMMTLPRSKMIAFIGGVFFMSAFFEFRDDGGSAGVAPYVYRCSAHVEDSVDGEYHCDSF